MAERVVLEHPDGCDVFRRFTFEGADNTSPRRLTLVEPYDPEEIDPPAASTTMSRISTPTPVEPSRHQTTANPGTA